MNMSQASLAFEAGLHSLCCNLVHMYGARLYRALRAADGLAAAQDSLQRAQTQAASTPPPATLAPAPAAASSSRIGGGGGRRRARWSRPCSRRAPACCCAPPCRPPRGRRRRRSRCQRRWRRRRDGRRRGGAPRRHPVAPSTRSCRCVYAVLLGPIPCSVRTLPPTSECVACSGFALKTLRAQQHVQMRVSAGSPEQNPPQHSRRANVCQRIHQ